MRQRAGRHLAHLLAQDSLETLGIFIVDVGQEGRGLAAPARCRAVDEPHAWR
jgi:hypothetical protein